MYGSKNLSNLTNVAQLSPIHAIILITISVILTIIGGRIQSGIASKKDTSPKTKKEPPKATAENWRIQLMSSPKKPTVEKAWKDISQKHKALLSDMSHTIISAEIAGKGTFYRLQAGRFATRDQAAALCTKLKAQKQDCVPVKADK